MSVYLSLPHTPRVTYWVCLIVGLAFVAAAVTQTVSNVEAVRDADHARARSVVATVVAHQPPVDGQIAETVSYRRDGRLVRDAVLYGVAANRLTPVGGTLRVIPASDDPRALDVYRGGGTSPVGWVEVAGWLLVAVALFAVSRRQRRLFRRFHRGG